MNPEPSLTTPRKTDRIDVDVSFVPTLPASLPAGLVLVHNDSKAGRTGFRAWLDSPGDNYERCRCGWANGREHYRAKSGLQAAGDAVV